MRFVRTILLPLSLLALAAVCHAQNGTLQVSTYPAATVADGHSTVTVTALVTTSIGQPVPDGTQVLFSTDLGTFDQEVVTTKDGYARATLIAGSIPGDATIKVKVLALPIAPTNVQVELVGDRAMLSAAKEYVEIVCPTKIEYSPQDRLIQAEGADKSVKIRYRDIEIEADAVQFNIPSYEIRAKRARVKIGHATRDYALLSLQLNTRKGFGMTTYTAEEPNGPIGDGRFFAFKTVKVERFGFVDVNGAAVKGSKSRYADANFDFADFSDAPALIDAQKAVVFPHKEIQFQRAELYVGDARVLRVPLFKSSLNGSSSSFTDQMVNVNDNQLSFSYPYYLTLKPGQTSLLRFHIGDRTGFGGGNGPQMDYELDWNKGDDMDGGFLLSGLGQGEWMAGVHQYYRLDNRSTAIAQVQMPAGRSIFGSSAFSHQFNGYNLSLNGSVTQTLQGERLTDQSYALTTEADTRRLAKNLPVRFSYGFTAQHLSTNAPVPIQTQDAAGLEAHFALDSQKIDSNSTFNSSLQFKELFGTDVGTGFGVTASATLTHRFSRYASSFLTYDFTQDPFEGARLGAHRFSGSFFFQKGNAMLNFNGGTSIDIDRVDYSASLSYQFAKLWRFAYGYTYDRFLGTSFLDYDFIVYYRISGREIGLTWSHLTNRLGLQILGASIN